MTTPGAPSSLLGYASTLLKTPYKWGGTGVGGFDCSGFVQHVFRQFGIQLPRVSQQQVGVGSAVNYRQAQPGDLVFYDEPGFGQAAHVGIYLGNGKMMDAPHTGASVQIEPIWQGAYFRRVPIPQGVSVGVANPKVAGTNTKAVMAGQSPSLDAGASNVDGQASTHYNASELESQYGYASHFFGSNPELQKLIAQAVKHQWSTDQFHASLQNTKWFRTHTDSQRSWIALQTSDPTSAARQLAMQATDIQRTAIQEGVTLDTATIKQLAMQVLSLGLNSDQLKQAISAHLKVDTTTQGHAPTGTAGTTYSNLKAMAVNYGVPMTEQAYDNWTLKIQQGAASQDSYTQYIMDQAKQIYPGLSQQIDKGQTTMDASDSYRKLVSNYLEIPEDQVTLSDPLVKNALNFAPQDPTGKSTPGASAPGVMPLWQFEQKVKSDPRWLQTNNARDSMTSTALQIGKDFGFVSGGA